MTTVEDINRIYSEQYERGVDRNCRMLELARHNGFEIEVEEVEHVGRLWMVPRLLQNMVGCMAAVVRP